MPKSSKEQIDDDEKKVILELQKNGKESINNIAINCGFSRQKVWRIINRIEKNKTVWGYSAVVDDVKLNQKRFFLLLKRTNKPIPKEKLQIVLTRELWAEGEKKGICLESSYFVHGFYDWIICVTAKDIRQVKKFCESLYSLAKAGYLSDIQIMEVLFPVEISRLINPNLEEFSNLF